MSKLGLSKEERNYVSRIALAQESTLGRIGFYAAALVPATGFGIYGIVRADFVALGLAFAGLLFFSLWRIISEIRHAPLFFSLFSKIDAFERDVGA